MKSEKCLEAWLKDSIEFKQGAGFQAFKRGGNWNNTTNAGLFTLNLNNTPANTNNNIGLRCVFTGNITLLKGKLARMISSRRNDQCVEWFRKISFLSWNQEKYWLISRAVCFKKDQLWKKNPPRLASNGLFIFLYLRYRSDCLMYQAVNEIIKKHLGGRNWFSGARKYLVASVKIIFIENK